MRKYSLFTVACFFCIIGSLSAQDRVAQLLQERDNLYQQYEQYMSQNSAFFGGKSKKDLTNIVNTLKGIIAKDNELIREVRLLSVRRESSAIGQNQATVSRIYELERETTSLRSQLNTTATQLKTRQEELEAVASNGNELRLIIVALSAGIVLLLGYVLRLRKKTPKRA